MNDVIKLISTFVDAVALVMALVLIVSLLHRSRGAGWVNSAMIGGMFSLAVAVTMSDPIMLPYEVRYDMRTLLIGTAVALLGPKVGLMALTTALIYRWGLGGHAVIPGMLAIILSFSGGLIWRYTVSKKTWAVWKKSVLLGIMISANAFAILLTPQTVWMHLFVNLVPYIFLSHIFGSLLLHHLISSELSFQSAAATSRQHASTDHLTGLLNRRGLDLMYPNLAEDTDNKRGRALLYFDIDRFKAVNDTHGHAVGDAVLKYVTDQIARNLRPQDIFARLGGDEFTVILSQIDKHEAERIAQRCRYLVSDGGFVHDGKILPISISIGAVWMLEHTEIDTILDEADKALYTAKTSGRNKVVFKARRPRNAELDATCPA